MSRRRRGLACLGITLAIWTLWPVYTRMGVIGALEPQDIALLRFGVSGLIFLPVLMLQAQSLPRRAWLWGLFFAICQGPIFVFLLALGLRLAPAGYGVALSIGVMPLFAAGLSLALFGERRDRSRLFGLACIVLGAAAMALFGAAFDLNLALATLLFLATALLAAIYAVAVPRSGLTGIQAAALLCVYSMIAYVPIYLAAGGGRLHEAPVADILLQGLMQGVLMSGVSLVAYSAGIVLLGAARAGAIMAITPAMTIMAAIPILGEAPHWFEALGALLIGLGVLFATGSANIAAARRWRAWLARALRSSTVLISPPPRSGGGRDARSASRVGAGAAARHRIAPTRSR